MINYHVVGGTHIGVTNCYGKKTFYCKDFDTLIQKLREDRNHNDKRIDFNKAVLEKTPKYRTSSGPRAKFEFMDIPGGAILFEFYIENEPNVPMDTKLEIKASSNPGTLSYVRQREA